MKTMSRSPERRRKFREKLKNDEKKLEAYQKKGQRKKDQAGKGVGFVIKWKGESIIEVEEDSVTAVMKHTSFILSMGYY